MKKLIIITGAVLIAYVIFSAVVGSAAGDTVTADNDLTEYDGNAIFVLCEQDDRVVVFRDGALFLRTDTPVSSLPKSDRGKLAQGIMVFSEKELKQLIEDYCS